MLPTRSSPPRPHRKIARRRQPQRLLEHRDERGDRFVAQAFGHALDRGTAGQVADGDEQVQLLPPAAEGQAGFAGDQAGQRALAQRQALGPVGDGAAVRRMRGQRVGQRPHLRVVADR